jgi:hypothetical protein
VLREQVNTEVNGTKLLAAIQGDEVVQECLRAEVSLSSAWQEKIKGKAILLRGRGGP